MTDSVPAQQPVSTPAPDADQEATQAMAKIETAVAKDAGPAAPQALTALRAKTENAAYIAGTGAFLTTGSTEDGKPKAEFIGVNKEGKFSSLAVKGAGMEKLEEKAGLFMTCNSYASTTAALPISYSTGADQLTLPQGKDHSVGIAQEFGGAGAISLPLPKIEFAKAPGQEIGGR